MSEKLQKVLANAGIGSRRELEQWIVDGRVRVNGKVATLGDRVEESDKIVVDGKPLPPSVKQPVRRVMVYHKPLGEVCTRSDPEGRPTVFDKLPRLRSGRWIVVGRLDINTSGLLLFTTDGELANKLMHPSTQIEREYSVRVRGDVDEEMLKRLKEGVLLEDGMAKFIDIVVNDDQNSATKQGANQWFTVLVNEGRNREVRRLWESQEVQVSRLKRVRFGSIFLPSFLKQGDKVELSPKEMKNLYLDAGMDVPRIEYSEAQRSIRERKERKMRSRGKNKPAR